MSDIIAIADPLDLIHIKRVLAEGDFPLALRLTPGVVAEAWYRNPNREGDPNSFLYVQSLINLDLAEEQVVMFHEILDTLSSLEDSSP